MQQPKYSLTSQYSVQDALIRIANELARYNDMTERHLELTSRALYSQLELNRRAVAAIDNQESDKLDKERF